MIIGTGRELCFKILLFLEILEKAYLELVNDFIKQQQMLNEVPRKIERENQQHVLCGRNVQELPETPLMEEREKQNNEDREEEVEVNQARK